MHQFEEKGEPYLDRLLKFISLGANIILTPPAERYRSHKLTYNQVLQPGWMPLTPPKVIAIGINPSTLNPVELEAETAQYLAWAHDPTLDNYVAAYTAWLSRLERWKVFNSWVRPIVRNTSVGTHLATTDLGWLNLVKIPSDGDFGIEEHHLSGDQPWFVKQLQMMDDGNAFIILGSDARKTAAAANYIKRHYREERFIIQSRNRYATRLHEAHALKLQAWLDRR